MSRTGQVAMRDLFMVIQITRPVEGNLQMNMLNSIRTEKERADQVHGYTDFRQLGGIRLHR